MGGQERGADSATAWKSGHLLCRGTTTARRRATWPADSSVPWLMDGSEHHHHHRVGVEANQVGVARQTARSPVASCLDVVLCRETIVLDFFFASQLAASKSSTTKS